MINLKNKIAFVTGGGRDIGKEVSKRLASCGANVFVNYYQSKEEGEKTVREINEAGGTAVGVAADLTKPEEVKNTVAKCIAEFGSRIDILVNVIGGLVARKTMEEMDEQFWDFVIGLNLKTAFLTTKEVLPYMQSGGAIVNFSSQAARDGGGPGAIAYATSKGGILTFTKGLAKELGPKGIRVNCVSPGMINTTFHNTFTKPEVRQKVAAATPLRREGEAAEVADLVAYLVSDKASFITGASIEINGGTYFI